MRRAVHIETVTMKVRVEQIIGLRHRVLRQGLPVESAHFKGDDDPKTWHIASFQKGRTTGPMMPKAICCASFMLNYLDEKPAWQLRGMATDTAFQGKGIGQQLLQWSEMILTPQSARLLWCNARAIAIPFYEKNGWQCISDTFDIPSAGPHRKMMKRI